MKDAQIKNPPLKYLIYSELAILQKSLCISAIIVLLVLVGASFIQLSMTCGNLGRYKEFEGLVQLMPMILVVLVSVIPFTLTEAILKSTNLDTRANWIKFRLSTPASALRLALAKYLTLLGSIAVSAIVSVIGIGLLALFGNDAITAQNIKLGLMLGLFLLILYIVMQVAMLYLRSQDKAGLVMLGFMMLILLPFFLKLSKNSNTQDLNVFEKIPELAEYFPIVVIAAAAVLVIGFVLTVIIFNRRER